MYGKVVYKSKVGWVMVLIGVFYITFFIYKTVKEPNWITLLLRTIIAIILFSIVYGTSYTIVNDKVLVIKSGFFFFRRIDIQQINRIAKTSSLIGSPAVSFDRMEIVYQHFKSEIISPKEKERFINHLLSLNPAIELKGLER